MILRGSNISISDITREILISSEYQFSELSKIIGEHPNEQSNTSDHIDFPEDDPNYLSDNPQDYSKSIVLEFNDEQVAEPVQEVERNEKLIFNSKNSEIFQKRLTTA